MAISFTEDQQKVIDTRNKNILVSAAAGSGKTAVLVERIVKLVTDTENPVDIDRLLIVTFTSAAASEMRERISDALTKCMDRDPDNEHLQKQMTLIHNAQITTIDSFCLFVIRNNFNDIGLDPGFRVADEAELKLLKKDVLAKLLEERFAEKEEKFCHCVECYSTNGKERNLEDIILQLYDFAMSYPFPEKWLQQCKEDYEIANIEDLMQVSWIQDMTAQVYKMLTDCVEQMEEAIRISETSDGPYMYCELLEREKEMIEQLAKSENYQSYYKSFQNISFDRLPGKKDESISVEKREIVKEIRNGVKETLQKIRATYFWISPEQCLKDLQASTPAVDMIIELALQFMSALSTEKREKNIVDFGDMEHFALNILLEEKEGIIQPTKTAVGYQEYYQEILIDEYQDSNLVQEHLLQSISKEHMGSYNRFMVGDVKQSIYKFRLARPELFLEKYHTYQEENENTIRIDLKQNFRSRKEVIESVNYLFYQIMQKEIGDVQYDEDAALYLGASYPKTDRSDIDNSVCQDNNTEVICIEKSEDNVDKKETEALVVAQKIKELVGKFLVTDKESGELRKAQYRDIVILLRSNAGWDEVFRKTLMEEGIPTYTTSKTGYFSAIEIQTVLNFLRILDNPLQDIPLCAVLTSPIFGFTEEELAKIRIYQKTGLFYDGLNAYVENGEEPKLTNKIKGFIELLQKYRSLVSYTPIHELLYKFMEEIGFYYYMSALPGGEQRKANLDQLMEKAIHFEQTSYHGLFHFIRYMEQMQKYDVDMGEANILDENADVVRIMSIHKSKGLEFPICIVAGMSKRFNMQDARKTMVMDLDYGIGTDYINPEERYKTATLRKNVIAMKMQQENIGEELRVLYVALTRAKEKLIMTGVVDDMSKKITRVIYLLNRERRSLPYSMLLGTNTYMDYILAALIRHRSFEPILEKYQWEGNKKNPYFGEGPQIKLLEITSEGIVSEKVEEAIGKELLKQNLLHATSGKQRDMTQNELLQQIDDKFSYQYPYQILSRLYTKTTVSEIKKMGHTDLPEEVEFGKILYPETNADINADTNRNENTKIAVRINTDIGASTAINAEAGADEEIRIKLEAENAYIPAFMREQEVVSGTTRGSAYHRVLELLELSHTTEIADVEEQIERFVREGRLSKAYADAVNREKILQFLKSPLAARMKKAYENHCLYREQPFVLGVPANEIEKEFPAEETILVQGIIDVYFEENGELILADYKTDRVLKGEELWERYRRQLDYYAKALTQLRGLPVKEKIIYSFALGKEV